MVEASLLPDEEISLQPCWFLSLREWHFFDYMSGNVIKENEQLICTTFSQIIFSLVFYATLFSILIWKYLFSSVLSQRAISVCSGICVFVPPPCRLSSLSVSQGGGQKPSRWYAAWLAWKSAPVNVSSDRIRLVGGGHVSTFAEYSMSVTVLSWKELTYVIVLVGFLPQCMPPLVAIKQINSRSCLLACIPDPFVRRKLQTQVTPSTFLHISVEGAQPDGSFHQCPNWSLFLLFLFCFFVRYRLRRGRRGARKRNRPVETEWAALPVPRLWQGVRQTADSLQTPVPAHRWARTWARELASVCYSM